MDPAERTLLVGDDRPARGPSRWKPTPTTKPIDFPVVRARVKAHLRMRPSRSVDHPEPPLPAQGAP